MLKLKENYFFQIHSQEGRGVGNKGNNMCFHFITRLEYVESLALNVPVDKALHYALLNV